MAVKITSTMKDSESAIGISLLVEGIEAIDHYIVTVKEPDDASSFWRIKVQGEYGVDETLIGQQIDIFRGVMGGYDKAVIHELRGTNVVAMLYAWRPYTSTVEWSY